MSLRNAYLEKQIRTKYVPNGVFREENTYLVRTSVNTYQIRTKYVLRISIFVAYLRFEMGKIRIAYFSLGYPPSSSPSHFTEHDIYDQELGRPMRVKG